MIGGTAKHGERTVPHVLARFMLLAIESIIPAVFLFVAIDVQPYDLVFLLLPTPKLKPCQPCPVPPYPSSRPPTAKPGCSVSLQRGYPTG